MTTLPESLSFSFVKIPLYHSMMLALPVPAILSNHSLCSLQSPLRTATLFSNDKFFLIEKPEAKFIPKLLPKVC